MLQRYKIQIYVTTRGTSKPVQTLLSEAINDFNLKNRGTPIGLHFKEIRWVKNE